jgi:hypothetical protein
MLVGTAETAIAMERIETMMDCFILKKVGTGTRILWIWEKMTRMNGQVKCAW